jgi:hypothetical protein
VKKTFFALFFSVAALSVCFSLAYAETVQEGSGGGGGDTSSASYQMKTAVADPGVSTSQSANYLYDHGTLWFDDEAVGLVSPPPSLPPATSPQGGGGGGSSGSGGGGSGSGWISSFFGGGDSSQVGGVSPAVDVAFTDTPAVVEAVKDIPRAAQSSVRAEDVPAVLTRVLAYPQAMPRIIRAVDSTGTVRAITVILVKNVIPWLLWLALALIVLGSVALAVFAAKPEERRPFLWIALTLIALGLGTSLIAFLAYRAAPLDMNTVVSSQTVGIDGVNEAMQKLATDLPLGAHRITVTGVGGTAILTLQVLIRPAFPF